MPLIKSARDRVFLPHAQIQSAARGLNDLIHELPERSPTRTAELITVENLMEHDRASRNLHVADKSALPVLLVRDHHTILVDALTCRDPTLERVTPHMREDIPM